MAESEKPTYQDSSAAQPGQIVTPGQTSQAPQMQQAVPQQSEQQSEQQPIPPQPAFQAVPQNDYAAQYAANEAYSDLPPEDGIVWTASEFIAHEKDSGWYMKLGLVAVLLTALIYFITRDVVNAGVVALVCLILGAYAGRTPRQLTYRVDAEGIQIGDKWHGYDEFRSFAIMPENAFSSIALLPLKRFAPMTSIYYAPDDEDAIVGMLSQALPMEERKHDAVDRLMQRIRF